MRVLHMDNNTNLPVFRVTFEGDELDNTVSNLRKQAEEALGGQRIHHIHLTQNGERKDFYLSKRHSENYLMGSQKLSSIEGFDKTVPVDFDVDHLNEG